MNLTEQWLEGKLCEKGFMKEEYKSGELVKKITPKGFKQIKRLLETDNESRIFLLKYLLTYPEDQRKKIVKNMGDKLKII